jgi:hypothetical protein
VGGFGIRANKLEGTNMDVDQLTVGELRQLTALVGGKKKTSDDSHWKVGKNYFLRTVTHHYTGRLVKVTGKELVLESAAWIADDGRFHDALRDGKFNEVEPYYEEQVILNRGALIDAVIWKHELPKDQK